MQYKQPQGAGNDDCGRIIVVGVGMGAATQLSGESAALIKNAPAVLAAPRLKESLRSINPDIIAMSVPEIIAALQGGQYEDAVVLASGDVGFFSIAASLRRALCGRSLEFVCAPSSLSYFAAKIGVSYEDMKLVSLHGRESFVVAPVCYHKKVFFLTGGNILAHDVIAALCDCGLGAVRVAVGENLAAADERIIVDTAAALRGALFGALCVVYVENENYVDCHAELRDEDFERDRVPITKEEVRAIALAKLDIRPTDTVFDIGAGSGSVAVAMARRAHEGRVFAIEKNAAACALSKKNIVKHGAYNVTLIEGEAAAVLGALPVPDCVFIGGSGGNLAEIIAALRGVRIVLTAITLETLEMARRCFAQNAMQAQIICVNVARAEQYGNYQLMKAQNPIYIISGRRDE